MENIKNTIIEKASDLSPRKDREIVSIELRQIDGMTAADHGLGLIASRRAPLERPSVETRQLAGVETGGLLDQD